MASPEAFEQLRREICASGPASDSDNLLGMEIDACAYLGDPAYADDGPGPWHDMTVERSEGAEWLITGLATGSADDAAAIAAELSRIWNEHIRYTFRSADTVLSTSDHVVLRAVTQIGPGDIWVTADIQVDLT